VSFVVKLLNDQGKQLKTESFSTENALKDPALLDHHDRSFMQQNIVNVNRIRFADKDQLCQMCLGCETHKIR